MNLEEPMKVSVIIPCYNEQGYIYRCVDSICSNLRLVDYPFEIIVVDGGSSDGTLSELERAASDFHRVTLRVLHNPHRYQVHALNIGIEAAAGHYIVRCDAHSIYPPGYIDRLVGLLELAEEDVGNVGTPHVSSPGADTAMARCISVAMTSPVAVGISHRSLVCKEPMQVDTLLFGAWKKSVLEKVGNFDTRFIRGQDLEHNLRLAANGYKAVLHPGAPFTFFTRPTLPKLNLMIRQYAAAKVEIAAHTRSRPVVRGLIPLAFFVSLIGLLFTPMHWVLPTTYGLAILVYSSWTAIARKSAELLRLALVIPSMHINHAMGTAQGIWSTLLRKRGPTKWSGTR
ncbi:glycosyltransferase [Dyella kyungheensis]|uniref:glycosyltransferase n=1 Tax=Dyella kyungheensis TaxID=1242174 RepID=UPI003CF13F87